MGTKLLIVDDEPFTVDMLETFLQINGFETVGALNGEDGLTLVKVEQPELVILDLMLPDIEGYEVCKRIRAYPQSAGLPVLVLSARAESSSKERAMEAGADAYLVKPVQFPLLLNELNRLLELKKSTLAAPAESPAQPTPSAPESFSAPSAPIPAVSPATPSAPASQPTTPSTTTPDKPSAPQTQMPSAPASPPAPQPTSQPTTPSPIPFHHSDPVKPNPISAPPSQQTNGTQQPPATPQAPENKPGSSS